MRTRDKPWLPHHFLQVQPDGMVSHPTEKPGQISTFAFEICCISPFLGTSLFPPKVISSHCFLGRLNYRFIGCVYGSKDGQSGPLGMLRFNLPSTNYTCCVPDSLLTASIVLWESFSCQFCGWDTGTWSGEMTCPEQPGQCSLKEWAWD